MSAILSRSLDEIEQQLLIELLPSSLRESVITNRLETTGISPQEIANRLLCLEERGLVASVLGFSEPIWCLTATGRALAQGLKMQKDTRHQYRQLPMFDRGEKST